MKNLFNNNTSNDISLIKDPFKQEFIESVSLHICKSWFSNKFKCFAIVSFKNGNTNGEHRIDDCEDLADAFYKAKNFVESL